MKTHPFFLLFAVAIFAAVAIAGCTKDYNEGPEPPPRDRSDAAPRSEGR